MRACIILFATICFFLTQTDCGGSQKPPKKGSYEDCKNRLGQILDSEEVCEPLAFEAFENEVMSWQKQCVGHTEPQEKKQVDEKIESTRACAEKQRQLNTWREQCSNRVSKISERKDCNGVECVANLEETKIVIKDCQEHEIEGTSIELANTLVKEFEKKIEEQKQEAGLKALKSKCAQAKVLLDDGKIKEAIEKLIEDFEENKELGMDFPKESSIEKSRLEAISSCGETLKLTTESYSNLKTQELTDKGLKKNPTKWIESYSGLEKISAGLDGIKADAIFPDAVSAIKGLIERFGKNKDNLESKTNKKASTKSRRALDKGIKQCKKLNKNLNKFALKVKHYTKKENEKKVNAYQAKLDKTEKALTTLKESLLSELELKVVSEKHLEKILENLKKAGCPPEDISKAKPKKEEPAPKDPAEKEATPATTPATSQ